jgi:hypothetical protein
MYQINKGDKKGTISLSTQENRWIVDEHGEIGESALVSGPEKVVVMERELDEDVSLRRCLYILPVYMS